MGAPELIAPGTAAGGPPVGGSGVAGTLPIWVGATTLGDSAVTQVAGSIFSLTGLVGGTGYSSSLSSAPVALGGGTGTGATASIVASGGVITWVGLQAPGRGYTAGDVLTIPGGVGGTITVLAVVPKNDASGHLTGQRIGAGTSEPVAGIDSRFGGWIRGWQRISLNSQTGGSSNAFGSGAFTLQVGIYGADDAAVVGTNGNAYRLLVYNHSTNSAITSGAILPQAVLAESQLSASSGTAGHGVLGVRSQAGRSYAGDQGTNVSLTAVQAQVFVQSADTPKASFTTANMSVFRALSFFATPGSVTGTIRVFSDAPSFGTGHALTISEYAAFQTDVPSVNSATTSTVTTYYGLRLRGLSTVAGLTVTNKYPHAQEDTDGRNYFRSPTFFGSAVGTARSATNPSVEVEAVAGVSNGDIKLRSAAAVLDAAGSSTNGVRFFARTTGDLPASTTQTWYEEGTYTPAGNVNFTLGNCTATWTRVGRKVFITLNFAAGTNNGSTAAGASSIGLPVGLAPARSGLGLRAQITGAASGNGLVAVNAATGLIEISTTVALDTNAKVIQCEYEV